MNTDLAYLIAIGPPVYKRAAALAIRSLREFGGFGGEILLITDAGSEVASMTGRPMDGRAAIPLPQGVEVLRLPPEEPAGAAPAKSYKLHIRHHVALHRYRRVLYLDADILVRGSLLPYLARCDSGRLVVTDDMGNRAGDGLCARCLRDDERQRLADRPGVCSGFFCAQGARLYEYLERWEEALVACAESPGKGWDQPPLNAAIYRGRIDAELVPSLMWFPGGHPQAPFEARRLTGPYLRALRNGPLVHYANLMNRPYKLHAMRLHHRLLHLFGGRSQEKGMPKAVAT